MAFKDIQTAERFAESLTRQDQKVTLKIGNYVYGSSSFGENFSFGYLTKEYGGKYKRVFLYTKSMSSSLLSSAKSICLNGYSVCEFGAFDTINTYPLKDSDFKGIKEKIPIIKSEKHLYIYHRKFCRWFTDLDDKRFKLYFEDNL